MPLLCIKPTRDEVAIFYDVDMPGEKGESNSPLYIYFPANVIIAAKSCVNIDLEIACEMLGDFGNNGYQNLSFYIYANPNLEKTPLIMANHLEVIDSRYRGMLSVAFRNLSDSDFEIKRGDTLLQICAPNLEDFKYTVVRTLSQSVRNGGGAVGGK